MKRILIIDDDVHLLKMMREMLERAGYEVDAAVDGDEGIRCYRARPADLVITDIIMPKKEGIETIMTLKREFPDVKIIAQSGGGRVSADDYLEIAQKIGVRQTLNKPIARQELLDAVAGALDG